MRVSTRARLTLYYAVVLAISLAAFAVALRVVTGAALLRSLDNSLLAASQLVQVDTEAGAPSFAQQQDAPLLRRGLVTLVLFDARGRVLGRMGSVAPTPPPVGPNGFVSRSGWRVYSAPIRGGVLRAYRSLDEFHSVLATLDRIILAGVPLVVLLAAGAGWWLSRTALAPVGALMRTAGEIAQSGDPGRRVPRRPGDDEMGRLVDLINAMLARLEGVIARERAFASAAAHQLRTPLAVIRGRAELGQRHVELPDAHRRELQAIERQAAEMQAMVASLLGLARTAGLRLTSMPLGSVLTNVLEGAELLAGDRGISVRADVDDAVVRGDPGLLQQALMALADNAIKFTPVGGTIALRTRVAGRNVQIIVEDSGPGIPEAWRERLLQPFQRGEAQQGMEGAGLGLALAREVVAAHGGTMHLEDSPLGGLAVRVALPLVEEADAQISGLAQGDSGKSG